MPTVDANAVWSAVVEIRLATVEASSTGSMKLLMKLCNPTVVETSDVLRKAVLTIFRRFGVLTSPIRFCVLTNPERLGVEMRLVKLGVLTRPLRFAVLTRPMRLAEETYPACPKLPTVEASAVWRAVVEMRLATVEASSTGSIKLLIKVCNPIVVETRDVLRKGVLTRFRRLGVLTRPIRLAVDTRFKRLGVETRFTKLGVLTRPIRLAVDTRFTKLGVLTRPTRF